MQKNISSTIFYSLIFAMGGAPTIAIMIIQAQTADPEVINSALLVLIQNAFLFAHRKNIKLEEKIEPLKKIYLVLNVICLLYWLAIQFL